MRKQINIRLSDGDMELLASLCDEYPNLTQSEVLRITLRHFARLSEEARDGLLLTQLKNRPSES